MSADLADGPTSTSLGVSIATDDEVVVLDVEGEIDLFSLSILEQCLDAAIEQGTGDIVVDLANVSFLDSSGLNLLLQGLRRLREGGRTLAVRNPVSGVEKVFTITGTLELLQRPRLAGSGG